MSQIHYVHSRRLCLKDINVAQRKLGVRIQGYAEERSDANASNTRRQR